MTLLIRPMLKSGIPIIHREALTLGIPLVAKRCRLLLLVYFVTNSYLR